MAVALKTLSFNSAQALCTFVSGATGAPAGITGPAATANIISITYDAASGKYTIFYT